MRIDDIKKGMIVKILTEGRSGQRFMVEGTVDGMYGNKYIELFRMDRFERLYVRLSEIDVVLGFDTPEPESVG